MAQQPRGVALARGADLHSLPPVTGHLTVGRGASVEPEVDLTGYWIDGDTLHVGAIRIAARPDVDDELERDIAEALKGLDEAFAKSRTAVESKKNAIVELEKMKRQAQGAHDLNSDRLTRANGAA